MKDMNCKELMNIYFKSKDEDKELREERITFNKNHKCDGEDCVRDGTKEQDFCDVCKIRHSYFLSLKKLQHQRSGIMKRVRKLTNN